MKKALLSMLFTFAACLLAWAQKSLTPAPVGMKTFYISHYGRHELQHNGQVNEYVLTDSAAHKERTVICQMVEHFPEVFVDKMPVDARSMTNACCILAMENAMVQLSTFYPNLNIHHNATRRDLGYLDQQHNQPQAWHQLLRKIIDEADSCITQPLPGISLRYGHETSTTPLVGLFPEGNHIQLVFYRRHLDDQDVLVKVLVDGKAITLPLPTKQSPYYKWSTLRTYCLTWLDLQNERREKP